MIPPDPIKDLTKTQQAWFDKVQAILTGKGFAVADQVSKPLTFTWNSDAPPAVLTAITARPLSVVVLTAILASNPSTYLSGLPCSWTWNSGKVTLSAITGLTASTDYTVTILVLS